MRPWPERPVPSIWLLEVDRPALVLGSTQPDVAVVGDVLADVVADVVADVDVEVARRRSGGGAVLVDPSAVMWVDVLVPAGDRLWEVDVGRAFLWLGRVWAEAIPGAEVHDGPLVRTSWSDLVCFAGLGPGEVTVGGRKVVGISQRRTREAALFQCAALLDWDAAGTGRLLGVPPEELVDVAAGLPIARQQLEAAFLRSVAAV
jgi:lipoate-protein ligase A